MDRWQDNSDGNRVYLGNFDPDGLNVNRNDPSNSNRNLGASLSRHAG